MFRLIVLVLALLPNMLLSQGTPAALDAAVEAAGPWSGPAQWASRVNNANIVDAMSANPVSYPVLSPGNPLGWALGNFYLLRWNRVVSRLGQPFYSPQPQGVRLTHLYSSSWIMENNSVSWAVDLVEGPFTQFGFANSVDVPQIIAMTAKLDALFVTHIDGDHCSVPMIVAMLLQGKPVICPPDLGNMALALGAPANLLLIPPTGNYQLFLPNNKIIFFEVYNGKQRQGTPTEVDCNAYRFTTSGGKHIVHSGDVEDPGFAIWVQTRSWTADYLIQPSYVNIPHTYGFLSHELEYTHFGAAHLKLNMPAVGPMPLNRFVLFWGESVVF